jgi:very-short-patch-repair endonuclease
MAALQQLPSSMWQGEMRMESVTPDGNLSIDIAAVTAAGVQLAIELDGPTHFVSPGNRLNGPTQFRNRMLAAQGYTVISIPYWEWDACKTAQQRHEHLMFPTTR